MRLNSRWCVGTKYLGLAKRSQQVHVVVYIMLEKMLGIWIPSHCGLIAVFENVRPSERSSSAFGQQSEEGELMRRWQLNTADVLNRFEPRTRESCLMTPRQEARLYQAFKAALQSLEFRDMYSSRS